jgi:hypothetical protein
MKKLFLLLIGILGVSLINAQPPQDKDERLFKGLFSVGLNMSQIDGDESVGYKNFGAHIGAGTMLQFHEYVSVSLEMIYSMRGAIERRKSDINPQTAFKSSMDYLEVPIMLNLNDRENVLFSIGLAPGVLVRNNLSFRKFDLSGDLTGEGPPTCLSNEPSQIDLSFVVGLQLLIKENYAIGGRFSYSVLGVRDACSGSRVESQFHNMVTLRFTYIL